MWGMRRDTGVVCIDYLVLWGRGVPVRTEMSRNLVSDVQRWGLTSLNCMISFGQTWVLFVTTSPSHSLHQDVVQNQTKNKTLLYSRKWSLLSFDVNNSISRLYNYSSPVLSLSVSSVCSPFLVVTESPKTEPLEHHGKHFWPLLFLLSLGTFQRPSLDFDNSHSTGIV